MSILYRARAAALFVTVLAALSACSTAPATDTPLPEPIEPIAAVAEVPPIAETAPDPVAPEPVVPFDPASVSVELKQATFFDVKALIQGLNSIIQAKDYVSWSAALTSEYKEYYSSPEVLAKISDAPVLKRQGIALQSLQDYFIHVVYPSRQNDRVDDIEFIDPNRIRAITINVKGERLVLYNLEKIGDTWKIAIWRQS